MNEKTGNIVKLEYDFDTARNLEVFMPNLNGWYRVTSREFRSFNGNRRILNVSDPSNSFYECYEGPIYFYGTNNKVPENELCEGYNYSGGVDPREQYRVTGRKGRI